MISFCLPGRGQAQAQENQRLVIELRDKVDLAGAPAAGAARPVSVPADPVQEAISALIALGYKPVEASRAVSVVPQAGLRSEDIIRAALKGLAGIK